MYFCRFGDLPMPDDEIDISAEIVGSDQELPPTDEIQTEEIMTEGVEEPVPEPEPTPEQEEEIVEEPEPIPQAGPKTMNRWLVVVGALLIQLALGAIY